MDVTGSDRVDKILELIDGALGPEPMLSTWNHRLLFDGVTHRLIEAYYDPAGVITGWSTHHRAEGGTVEDLRSELLMHLAACDRPVLTVEDLP
jgi:hypothetical protein